MAIPSTPNNGRVVLRYPEKGLKIVSTPERGTLKIIKKVKKDNNG
jgi:hypothetical protein